MISCHLPLCGILNSVWATGQEFFPEGEIMKIKIKDLAFEFVSMSVMMALIIATVVTVLTII
ncbi:MAG: hypothetical protein HXM49_02775 [Leptotrichia sp.]|nr:hypothetical protein [Leptotrichia sp.]